jgi:hypothetical protein
MPGETPCFIRTLSYNEIALHMVSAGIKAKNYRMISMCLYGHSAIPAWETLFLPLLCPGKRDGKAVVVLSV